MQAFEQVEDREYEFLKAIGDLGYSVFEKSNNPKIVHIKGRSKTIRCNLHCTTNLRNVSGLECYWFGVRKNVLTSVDYVVLAPVGFFGFYIIPVSKFMNNSNIFFKNEDNQDNWTFHLCSGEELIYGYSNQQFLKLHGMHGIVTKTELEEYGVEKPTLPFFPPL